VIEFNALAGQYETKKGSLDVSLDHPLAPPDPRSGRTPALPYPRSGTLDSNFSDA
jgi:hypothetical protein